jgi:hypothetical protein
MQALLSGALEHAFAAMFRQQQTMQSERAKALQARSQQQRLSDAAWMFVIKQLW